MTSVCFFSCTGYVDKTPLQYRYYNGFNSRMVTSKDKDEILSRLYNMLSLGKSPFVPIKAFSKSNTVISIDSLIYSPDKTGIVALIITKTSRNSIENGSLVKVVYDGNYLFVKKDSLLPYYKIYDYSSINFVNFSSYFELKETLREYCFGRRATEDPYSNNEPRYNMDDIRFWKGDQFRKIYSDTSYIK